MNATTLYDLDITDSYGSNTTDDSYKDEYIYGKRVDTFRILTYSFGVFGFPGNVLVIVVLGSSPHLYNKPINRILMHQSFIDAICCAFMLIEEYFVSESGIVAPYVCHYLLTRIFAGIPMYVSTYNIVFMTIERHLAVSNPLKYDSDKVKRRLPYIFVTIWLGSYIALAIVPATTTLHDGQCRVAYHLIGTSWAKYYGIHCFVLSIVIPIIIMGYCYLRMFLALNSSLSMGASSSLEKNDSATVHKSRLAQLNIFQTCLTVTVVFLLCWATNETCMMAFILDIYKNFAGTHCSVGRILTGVNSCLNPYIYALRYTDFKHQLQKLIRFQK